MATINGTPEKDLLKGTQFDDSIFGLAGNDRLSGTKAKTAFFVAEVAIAVSKAEEEPAVQPVNLECSNTSL